MSATPQLSTQVSGWAQLVAQEVSAFPHSSTHVADDPWQDPTTQGLHAPLRRSHTSPFGQGQVMLPQPSLQLAVSAQTGTHLGAFAAPPHPISATVLARATARRRKDTTQTIERSYDTCNRGCPVGHTALGTDSDPTRIYICMSPMSMPSM